MSFLLPFSSPSSIPSTAKPGKSVRQHDEETFPIKIAYVVALAINFRDPRHAALSAGGLHGEITRGRMGLRGTCVRSTLAGLEKFFLC